MLDFTSQQSIDMVWPDFMTSRQIDLAIATSGYCQARCASCIWPYMDGNNSILSLQDFSTILDRFADFNFGELALNMINEPFIDKTIAEKLIAIASRRQNIDVLYFSSNWLLPTQTAIDGFVAAIERCASAKNIRRVHLNATISGIDQKTYDILQAGANLTDVITPYRSLDFERAVSNVCKVLLGLSKIKGVEKVKFQIKAYGELFTSDDMQRYWGNRFDEIQISREIIRRQVKISLNSNFTTFARKQPITKAEITGHCTQGWLDRRLVIGARGDVGLCCEDGLRSIMVGNLLLQDLHSFINGTSFQEHLAFVVGKKLMPNNHPCRRCSFIGGV